MHPQKEPRAGNLDLGDFYLAFNVSQNLIAALSNHVTGGATVSAAAGAPYTPITSPLITRKSSGIFIFWAQVTISINGGTLADADNVTFNPIRVTPGGVSLNQPLAFTSATTSTGAAGARSVVAYLTVNGVIDNPAINVGSTASYGILVAASNAHTSGVVATTDGQITVLELPG